MSRAAAAAVTVALLALAAFASPAAAERDGYITSFDGTKIVYYFFPADGLKPAQRAPTVMVGPGYSQSHPDRSDSDVDALLKHGYNVLSWDPRGFGDSGGNVEIDSPQYEARDASLLVDLLAKQPEAQLDRPGDPRVGMTGRSYGGGIEWITAAIDHRIDAIAPQISWHSLVTSLDKSNTAKGGWGSILFGLGVEGTTVPGLQGGPAGFQFGRTQDPQANEALANGAATGELTPEQQAFFAARGPDFLLNRIHIPVLIMQGTSDTLFTLHEAIENYASMKAQHVPLKMVWFCGTLLAAGGGEGSIDHGICETSPGPDPHITTTEAVRWMDRWLKGDTHVDTGPRFEWISQPDGVRHGASDYPLPQGPPVTATGSGTLPLVPGDTSGALISASPATNALNVKLPAVAMPTQLVGEPTLTLDYSGSAANADGRLYAQLVDNATNKVVGPIVTPVPVTLDGKDHSLTIPLEGVALDATPQSSYSLQITDGSNVYFGSRQPGLVTFKRIAVSVPTVGPSVAAHDVMAAPRARAARALRLKVRPRSVSIGCRRVAFTVTSGGRPVSGAKVVFRGHRVHTGRRGRAKARVCVRRAGSYVARAGKRGFRTTTARVRARTAG